MIIYHYFKILKQYFVNIYIESGDEETEGESCKTKHARGKKVSFNTLNFLLILFSIAYQWIFITDSQGCYCNKYR